MSNITSEYMDYEGVKTTMTELNTIFENYSEKLNEIDEKMGADINAGEESALDSTVLGRKILESWDDLANDFKKFKDTFDLIYSGVAQSSTADEALENLAVALFSGENSSKDGSESTK